MLDEQGAKRRWGTLIEQNAHLRGREGPASCVLQRLPDLIEGDAREPLNKVSQGCTVFEILEERGHRNPRAAQNPRATKHAKPGLESRTSGPVDHQQMLALSLGSKRDDASEAPRVKSPELRSFVAQSPVD